MHPGAGIYPLVEQVSRLVQSGVYRMHPIEAVSAAVAMKKLDLFISIFGESPYFSTFQRHTLSDHDDGITRSKAF